MLAMHARHAPGLAIAIAHAAFGPASQGCLVRRPQVQAASGQFLSELGRHNYVTPTSYLELLAAFKGLLATQRSANAAAHRRYSVGLEKLASSAAQVAGMQAELMAMQPQLVATVAEVEGLMARIAHEKKVRRCFERGWSTCMR